MTSDEETRQYEELIRKETKEQHSMQVPYGSDLTVYIQFYLADRKHGDIDNLAKAVLDGMQTVAFKDDNQIKTLNTNIVFIKDSPEECQGDTKERIMVTILRRK